MSNEQEKFPAIENTETLVKRIKELEAQLQEAKNPQLGNDVHQEAINFAETFYPKKHIHANANEAARYTYVRVSQLYQKKIAELTAQLQTAKSETWDECTQSFFRNTTKEGIVNTGNIKADKAAFIGQSVNMLTHKDENWFEDNRKFVEWFSSSGLDPFKTSYEKAKTIYAESVNTLTEDKKYNNTNYALRKYIAENKATEVSEEQLQKEAEAKYPYTEAIYEININTVVNLERKAYIAGSKRSAVQRKTDVEEGIFIGRYFSPQYFDENARKYLTGEVKSWKDHPHNTTFTG